MGSLKKNFIYQSLYQVLIVVLPLITAPYVARVLGVDNSGIYSYTNTIANYFVVFGMLGLEQYGNRCIAQVRDDKEALNKVFSELFFFHILVSIVVISVYFVYCLTFVTKYRYIFLLQGFYVTSVLFDVNWFFFGIENFKLTVTRNTIIKILTVVATFCFVKKRDDLDVYTLILASSMLLSQLAVWPMLKRNVKLVKIPIKNLRKHCKPLLFLFVAVLAANLNRMIDKVMLGWFDRISDLGCYDYADRIIRIPLSFIAAIGTVMLSRMSNLFANDRNEETNKILDKSACLILLLSFGMGFGIAAIAPEFVIWFLGAEYKGTIILLRILSMSIPLVGWNNFIKTQILIPKEMDMVYTKAVLIGALMNILCNCVLIYSFGAKGASVATVISYSIILIMMMQPLALGMKKNLKYAIFPTIAGLFMYCSVRLASMITDILTISVCVELIVGTIVYCSLTYIYILFIKSKQIACRK